MPSVSLTANQEWHVPAGVTSIDLEISRAFGLLYNANLALIRTFSHVSSAATYTGIAVGADWIVANGAGAGTVTISWASPDPPSAPTSLTATAGIRQAVLAWTPGAGIITRWEVRQRIGQGAWGSWTVIAGSGPTTTSHTVTGLTAGTGYGFQVRAVNNAGNGAASAEATATPFAPGPPPAPTSLTATAGVEQATLAWVSGGDGGSAITRWEVRRRIGQGAWGSWTAIAGSGPTTTSHTVTGLTAGTTYGFQVRAVNAAGNGAASAEATATTPSVPPAPSAFTATAGVERAVLAWVSGGDGGSPITRWEVRRRTGQGAWGAWSAIAGSGAATRSHTVTGLDNGTSYGFQVRAVNAAGAGAPSAEARATPVDTPPAPRTLTARGRPLSAELAWTSGGDGGSPITRWEVRRRESGGQWGDWTPIPGSGPSTTSHTVTGLVAATSYGWQVRAANARGAGDPSPEATATATSGTRIVRLRPGTPVLHVVDAAPSAPRTAPTRWRRSLRHAQPQAIALQAIELEHPRAPGDPLLACSDVADRTLGGRRYQAARFTAQLASDDPDRPPRAQVLVPWSAELADVLDEFDGAAGAKVTLSEWSWDRDAGTLPEREWQVVLWAATATLSEVDIEGAAQRVWALSIDLSVTPRGELAAAGARYGAEDDPWTH